MKQGRVPGTHAMPNALETVISTWGHGDKDRVPDWVLVLAEACDAQSRGKIAKRLGYSQPVISQVLNHNYLGNLERVAEMVRGALMSATVDCPVNGETKLDTCLTDQKRTPPFASGWRMQVYKACRNGCPNFRGGK